MALVRVAAAAAALAAVVSGQSLAPRVSNSRGCDGFQQSCTITLQEGLDVMVQFQLDEPIICTGSDYECSVIVNISNSHPHFVAVEPCFVRWDRTEWHQTRQVRVTAVQNYRNDANEHHQVHLDAQVLSMAAYYDGFDVEDLYIETEDRRTAQCRATGDPHYTTFDGKYWHYYQASTVTLYRATRRDFAIQTRTTGYPGRNCAIAGREERDRVIVDRCGGRLQVISDFNSPNPEQHPRIQVSGNTYTVYFYSGAWFRAQVNSWGMNVYTGGVDASTSSSENTCGLCGNFNGNSNDDVPGYRITNYNQLFSCMKVPSVATNPVTGQSVSFGNIWSWTYNEADFTSVRSVVPLPQVTCPYEFVRIERPIINPNDQEDITDALRERTRQIQNQGGGQVFTFGGTNGDNMTTTEFPLDQSRAECTRRVQSSATVQECIRVFPDTFGNEIQNFTDDCARDYSHSGGPTPQGRAFIDGTIRALEQDCLLEAVAQNETGLLELQRVLCENACSGNGQCGAGAECTCNEGFGGADCSIDLNAPPQILQASDLVYDSSGLQRNHTPAEILLSGTNILLGTELACRFGTTVTQATYIGPTQVLCEVPVLRHRGPTPLVVPMQVTNNGNTWSAAQSPNVRFTFYDGHCQACADNGVCGPNPSTCNIDGQCYLRNAQHPTNVCMQCIPSASNTNWTYTYSHRLCRPQFTRPLYDFEIVGAATRGTVMLYVNASANALVNQPANVAGGSNYSDRIRYSYAETTGAGQGVRQWFTVDPVTGAVILNQTVNMSDPAFMNMQHAATDPTRFNGFFRVVATGPGGYNVSADISIDLVPLDAHGNIFPRGGYIGTVREGQAVGAVLNLTAFNLEPSVSQALVLSNGVNMTATRLTDFEWFYVPQGMDGALSISEDTGAVTVRNGALFDYELMEHLNYRVRATYELQHITPLYINVQDVPEPPTDIVTSPANPTLPEDTTGWVANLSTIDGDAIAPQPDGTGGRTGGPFVYTITAQSSPNLFALGQFSDNTTYLNVSTAFDFEDNSALLSHTVTIRTEDPTNQVYEEQITVTITNVNEAPDSVTILANTGSGAPMPAATVASTAPLVASISVYENATVGSRVAILGGNDPDSGDAEPLCTVIDPEGKWHQDAGNRFMVLVAPLDFEVQTTSTVQIQCFDAVDSSLLSPVMNLTVNVLNVDDPPTVTNYVQGSPINETNNRTEPVVVGRITAVEEDDTTNGSDQISVTVPSGFSTGTRNCSTDTLNRITCTIDILVDANTTLNYENTTNGTLSIPVVVSQGGRSRTAIVNTTVVDLAEGPTGISLSTSTITENPSAGDVAAVMTIQDPDTGAQQFEVTLDTNPNNALSLRASTSRRNRRQTNSPVGGRLWELVVSNPSAFDFEVSPSLTFSVTVRDMNMPAGTPPMTRAFTMNVIDADLAVTENSTVISLIPGEQGVEFTLQNQDRNGMNSRLRWELVWPSTTQPEQLQNRLVMDPATGVLRVVQALCMTSSSFRIGVRYYFTGENLPSGYGGSTVIKVLTPLTQASGFATDLQYLPVFSQPSFTVTVPFGASTPSTLVVNVTTPCGEPANLALQVVSTQEAITAGQSAGADAYEPIASYPGAFYEGQPSSVAQAGWIRAPRANTNVARADTRGPTQVNTAISVLFQPPSASMTLPHTAENYMLVAGVYISSSRRTISSFAPLTIQYEGPTTTRPTINIGLPPRSDNNVGAAAGSTSSGDDGVGVIVAIVLAILFVVLIALVLYFRRQKNNHIEFDSDKTGRERLPTFSNPTYDSAPQTNGPVQYDSVNFRPGVENPNYDWYKPAMTRKECTEYLIAQGEGAFVIRDSDANPGWHMLGVKTQNRVVHDKIRMTENGEYQLLPSFGEAAETAQPNFKDIPAMVDHYIDEPEALPYVLAVSNPIYDNHQLIQERMGQLVKKDYDDIPAVPEKDQRKYDEVPAGALSGDGVSNPMYGKDGTIRSIGSIEDGGYLDVSEQQGTGMQYESI